jgi:hypothetical protein
MGSPAMEKRNILSITYGIFNSRQPDTFALTLFVDGVALTRLVSEFEKARGYEPAGTYGPIIPAWFEYGPRNQYFLGEHRGDSYFAKIEGQYVLGCECGEVGCWPIQCRIKVVGSDVVWDQFQQPHRLDRDYSGFGPFVFDGVPYREAVARLAAQIAEHRGEAQ